MHCAGSTVARHALRRGKDGPDIANR